MKHRELSIQFLENTGLIPVKVRPNQKDPFPDWDPARAENQDHSLTLKQLKEDKSLNLGALFFGKYVDVDVDTTNTYLHAALDHFLPRTQYVWGRASKRKGHRIYILHEDFQRAEFGPLLKYLKGLTAGSVIGDSLSLEVRGGEPKHGMFAVLPGSFHSGELIEWQDGVDPTMDGTHIEIHDLLRQIRLAVMAAIMASVWTEGSRNDLSLAFAGLLWRIRQSTLQSLDLGDDEQPDDGTFVLTYDDCENIIKCVMKLAGDDPGDERSRMINLHNSWRKLDGDVSARVSGGKALAEMIGPEYGVKIVKAAYRLLSDSDSAEQIEKLAEQFVMWYGQGVIIDLELVKKSASLPWMNYVPASFSLAGKKITIGDVRIPVVDMLFKTGICSRVMGLTFDPSTDELLLANEGNLYVNQWRGFKEKPCEQKVSVEEVKPFIDYVHNVLCSGDDDARHWVLAWLADILQKPAQKPGTSLVLVGVMGAGKSFLGERVMGPIIGDNHYAMIDSVGRLTNNFNTILDNKLFIQCDEAVHSYQKETANKLKGLITSEKVEIEPKGLNSYSKPNHIHMLFTSNSETAALFIDASPFERRYTVLKVNTERATDLKYWEQMHAWIEQARPKVMRYLLDYKYERALIRRPLATLAKAEMQRVGLDPEVSWILYRIRTGHLLDLEGHKNWFDAFHDEHITEKERKHNSLIRHVWPNRVTIQALEEDYKAFVRRHGRPVYSGSVMTTIRRVFPAGALEEVARATVKMVDGRSGQETKDRVRLMGVPSIEDIHAHLVATYGPVIESLSKDENKVQDYTGEAAAPEDKSGEF